MVETQARPDMAEGELRTARSMAAPERSAGRRILVFDDVHSKRFSMGDMARVLLAAGATEVAGPVLTRHRGG